MALSESIISRLRHQHTIIPTLIANLSKDQLEQHPVPGKSSALEQIAHLAAYQPIFIDRLKKISSGPAVPPEPAGPTSPSEAIRPAGPAAPSPAIAASFGAPAFERYVADDDPHFHECTTWSPGQLTQSLKRIIYSRYLC